MNQADSPVDTMIRDARLDPSLLGELLERYRGFLLLEGQTRLGVHLEARIDAADLVQETFLKATRRFDQFNGSTEPEFTAWVNTIFENSLKDQLRKHGAAEVRAVSHERRFSADPSSASFFWKEPAGPQTTASQRLIRGEKALRLAHLLQELPPAQRDAVQLRHLEGKSLLEIASALDRSLVAAAGLIKRGLQNLRQKMSEQSWF